MAKRKRRGPRVVEMEVTTVQRGGDRGTPKRGDLSRGLVRALEAVMERRRERGMSPRAQRVAREATESVDRAFGRDDMAPFTLEEAEAGPDMEFSLEEAESRPRYQRVRRRAMDQAERAGRSLADSLEGGSFGELRRRGLRNRGTGGR
jgi:hypothetical protein